MHEGPIVGTFDGDHLIDAVSGDSGEYKQILDQ
jgi:hypothetical protein